VGESITRLFDVSTEEYFGNPDLWRERVHPDDIPRINRWIDDIFQANLCFTYRINRPKAGHEFILDIYNVTNAKGKTWEYYNEYTDDVDYDRQFNIMPNIIYRIHF
jgi:hypothetical protein